MQDFQLLEKLSEGATADVFWAQARGSSERVVMEVLRPELMRDPDALHRFMMEVEFRRSLNHPNLARRLHRGKLAAGNPFVVSEPVFGQSLRQCLSQNGSLSQLDVVRLVRPLCDAVVYLHQAGLTHGNLCPENIFLEGGLHAFRPKLLDSGLAFLRVGSRLQLPVRRHLVKAEYLSPERIQGQRATPASDIYALGVLLFEALTGKPPFTHPDPDEVRGLHLRAMPPPLPTSAKLMSGIIHRCLAKDPADRFANVVELREAFARPPSAPKSLRNTPLPSYTPEPSVPPPPTRHAEPDVVGQYQLLRPLGKGGMGRVFAARHLKLGRLVAIKLLHPELARNKAFVERLVREAQAANRINHEHIVEIHDFVEEPNSPSGPRYFCVMELLTGLSLEQLLRQQAPPIGRAVGIMRQVCSALEAAHEVGVVHRDVKPDNIFLTQRHGRQDFVKVLDFGVAKLLSVEEGVTQGGEIIGTPSYMSPEQLTAREPDARTDVYALGVVLYRILAGQVPFKSKSFAEHCTKVMRDPPPALPERTPAGEVVPLKLAELVLQCLAKKAIDRPQSMAEVSARLTPFEGMAPSANVWPEALSPTPPPVSGVGMGEPLTEGRSIAFVEDFEEAPPSFVSEPSSAEPPPMAAPFEPVPPPVKTVNWRRRLGEAIRTPLQPRRAVQSAEVRRRGIPKGWLALGVAALLAGAFVWGRLSKPPSVADLAQGAVSTVELTVTSEPPGARVIRVGSRADLGITPLTVRVPRDREWMQLRFEWPSGGSADETVRPDRDRTVHAVPSASVKRAGRNR